MKNYIVCESCKAENALYKFTCSSCGAYIRERVYNLDFWSMIWRIFESPVDSFRKIIFAEHKNFLIVILFLAGIKFSADSALIRRIFMINPEEADFILPNLLIGMVYFILILILLSFLLKFLNRLFKLDTRFKDNLATYCYAFAPRILALLILLPVQLALFGKYFLTFNPSPFEIKSTEAYLVFGIDGLMLLWNYLLIILASYAHSKSIIYSILTGTAVFAILSAGALFLPMLPF